jgi:hypothetical protein
MPQREAGRLHTAVNIAGVLDRFQRPPILRGRLIDPVEERLRSGSVGGAGIELESGGKQSRLMEGSTLHRYGAFKSTRAILTDSANGHPC